MTVQATIRPADASAAGVSHSAMTLPVHPAEHPLYAAECHLRSADVLFERIMPLCGPCELYPPPATPFHFLIKTIIDQQLSAKVAQTLNTRLLARLGTTRYKPDDLLQRGDTALTKVGLSRAKARYILGLAQAVSDGTLDLAQLATLDDDTAIQSLQRFAGIGPWTAEVFLMFGLGRLDILPLGDLGIRRAMQRYYRIDPAAARDHYLDTAAPWQPYRSVAAWYLWAIQDNDLQPNRAGDLY